MGEYISYVDGDLDGDVDGDLDVGLRIWWELNIISLITGSTILVDDWSSWFTGSSMRWWSDKRDTSSQVRRLCPDWRQLEHGII
jgi:hypothetical protein